MGRFVGYAPCPRCRARGADRCGDNLGMYADGSLHCYACGYHKHATHYVRKVKEEPNGKEGVLPRDFTREVPAAGWKWLLSYGLPYSHWKRFAGFSPASERLVLTHGDPVEYSVGRYIGKSPLPEVREHSEQRVSSGSGLLIPTKWRAWGDRLRTATVLDYSDSDSTEGVVCVVEDIVSAHVVAQVVPTLPIFGTSLYPKAIQALRALKRPIRLWIDWDQRGVLAPKINRLQAFLDLPVTFIEKRKDPKRYSINEVKEILYDS